MPAGSVRRRKVTGGKPKRSAELALCGQMRALRRARAGDLPRVPAEMLPHGELTSFQAPLDSVVAAFTYEGRAAQAVRRLKFARVTSLAAPMAQILVEVAHRWMLSEADWVVPVPIHWTRWCSRGFNQADLLAERFPQRHPALLRWRRTRPQVGLSAGDRFDNPVGAFRANADVQGKTILLIDDVVTTGSTGLACAQALREAGAKRVNLLAFCRGEDPPEARFPEPNQEV